MASRPGATTCSCGERGKYGQRQSLELQTARDKQPAFESIARGANAPVATVAHMYEQQIEALSRDARIKSFIPVLAESRVRYQLRLVKGPVATA